MLLAAGAILVLSAVFWKVLPRHRSRYRGSMIFVLLWLVCWVIPALAFQSTAPSLLEIAGLQLAAGIAFEIGVMRFRLPRFVPEIGVVAAYIAILVHLLVTLGVNLTGIFATSAVATAMVGFALQDMMANIAGGISLELERGLRVGDFVKAGDNSGWVKFVRLRSTVIETPDGNTVVLPNSALIRSAFTVVGNRRRTFIPFRMPYNHNPQEVMDTVTAALRSSPLPGIAEDPMPLCVIQQMLEGHVEYAAVVWMTEPGKDTVFWSGVLNRVYFALVRAGMAPASITHVLEMHQPGERRSSIANPTRVLKNTPIFRLLAEDCVAQLGAEMIPLSFAPGEFIIRQNEPGDSMYFLISGQVRITFSGTDTIDREVASVGPGEFFGEASLLTGEVRNASAVATTRVDCYRLQKVALEDIMTNHPDLAEDMSVVIAHRQMELAVVRNLLDEETARRRAGENQTQLLARIRRFFDID